MAQAEALASATASALLQEWGKLLVGQWTLTGPGPEDQRSLAVSWMPGGTALISDNASSPSAAAGRAVTVADAASGQIKQTEVYSDGKIETTYISKLPNGQWAWRQTSTASDGTQETNTATFTLTNGGNTLLHNVTNRSAAGNALPDKGHVLKRVG
ncbi:MAG: hypothetical protein ABSA78_08510 [Candidatus Sulfotelmatobacter sp.]|jgi:hypothetical protein